MKQKNKKQLFTLLKIVITIALLYFVFNKIPLAEVLTEIKKANIFLLFLSLCCFVLSQWVSAERLLQILRIINFSITRKANNILYLIGMFYNFFIPGGIGGDAYKVYLLNKQFNWSVKKLSAALLIDRLMGLVAIVLLLVSFFIFIPYFKNLSLIWIFPVLMMLIIVISYYITKRLFPSFVQAYKKALIQSIILQSLQCLCIVFIMESITEIDNYAPYLILFLVSSVLSIFSFSGVGIRELVFYQASIIFVFDTTSLVTTGVLFSAMTAFVSLFGIVFHFMKPEKYIKEYQYISNV